MLNFDADIVNDDNCKSFKYKNQLLGNTAAQPAPLIEFWKMQQLLCY